LPKISIVETDLKGKPAPELLKLLPEVRALVLAAIIYLAPCLTSAPGEINPRKTKKTNRKLRVKMICH
jgi:hypothetical protein